MNQAAQFNSITSIIRDIKQEEKNQESNIKYTDYSKYPDEMYDV